MAVLPLTSILKQPWTVDTPPFNITDSYHGPNCAQIIFNDPDLIDAHQPFQQDCLPLLLELTLGLFNHLQRFLASSDFGCMISVGAIRFEDRFCTSRERVAQGEVGGWIPVGDSAWRLLQLAVEKLWSMPGGQFIRILAQTGIHVENAPFTL